MLGWWVERLQLKSRRGGDVPAVVTGTGGAVIGLRPAHRDEVEELIQDTIRPGRGEWGASGYY